MRETIALTVNIVLLLAMGSVGLLFGSPQGHLGLTWTHVLQAAVFTPVGMILLVAILKYSRQSYGLIPRPSFRACFFDRAQTLTVFLLVGTAFSLGGLVGLLAVALTGDGSLVSAAYFFVSGLRLLLGLRLSLSLFARSIE
jgi:hypothetical protein